MYATPLLEPTEKVTPPDMDLPVGRLEEELIGIDLGDERRNRRRSWGQQELGAGCMPRRPRLHIADYSHHIIQRGHNRAACFFAEEIIEPIATGSVRHSRRRARRSMLMC